MGKTDESKSPVSRPSQVYEQEVKIKSMSPKKTYIWSIFLPRKSNPAREESLISQERNRNMKKKGADREVNTNKTAQSNTWYRAT